MQGDRYLRFHYKVVSNNLFIMCWKSKVMFVLILFCLLFSEVGKSDIVSADCIAYSPRTILCNYASHNQAESATRVSYGQI